MWQVVAMSETEDVPGGDMRLLFERDWLESQVELILGGGPKGADALARLLDAFRDAIDGGLRGVEAAREGILTTIELAYLRTGEHAAALRLYRLSLEGRLKPGDEPAQLIGAAVARRTAGARELAARGQARESS
jgi:hypothetical protein